jgi:hypothetical protein
VRGNAFEIGGDEIRRRHLRIRGRDAGGGENIRDRRGEPLRVDRNGLADGRSGRHQRASSSSVYQDGRSG